ncbi:MAG: hypothetical protein QOH37_3533 [Nocardioidaceae bacterium]|nr:hypothetical protein [Nocardioidaceae bacterium]
MTTTPQEPLSDPEIVPSGQPNKPLTDPNAPGEPDTESDPQTDPANEGPDSGSGDTD